MYILSVSIEECIRAGQTRPQNIIVALFSMDTRHTYQK